MYKSIRYIRIGVSIVALLAPTIALVGCWNSLFERMQIMIAITTGAALWLLVWIIVTLIYGRIYCSTVCPLGTMMDGVSAIGRKIPRHNRMGARLPSGYRWHAPHTALRFSVLMLVLVCLFCGWTLLPSLLDPFSAYARVVNQFLTAPLRGIGPAVPFVFATFATALTIVILVVAFSLWRGRLLCNTICPVGALLGLVGRKPVFHADINTDLCINCGECERVCKAECIKLTDHAVDCSRCVVCFKCMSVCPNGAITYRTGSHRLTMPLSQPTAPLSISRPNKIVPNETISPTAAPHPGKRD